MRCRATFPSSHCHLPSRHAIVTVRPCRSPSHGEMSFSSPPEHRWERFQAPSPDRRSLDRCPAVVPALLPMSSIWVASCGGRSVQLQRAISDETLSVQPVAAGIARDDAAGVLRDGPGDRNPRSGRGSGMTQRRRVFMRHAPVMSENGCTNVKF
jgi:hypothetical protein